MFLTSLGVSSVTLATNGQEAVDLWMNGQFDLILMDCQMPVMDGHQATRLIREHERKTNARRRQTIVGLSAGAMVEDRRAAMASGMDDYLSKPVKRNSLAHCLDLWGNQSGSHD
jgi:CheY-like chemotaxis protein